MMALDSLLGTGSLEQPFRIQKTIDGLPGVNGSTQLAGARLMHFSALRRGVGQSLYEFPSSLDEFLRQLKLWGQMHEAHMPTYMLDSFALIFEVFESAHMAPEGVITLPSPGERSLGMHSVHVTGFEDGGDSVVFANSWGPAWGRRGYGLVSRQYLERYFYEALTTRFARWGPTFDKAAIWNHPIGSKPFRDAWAIKNPTWSIPIRSPYGNWRATLYESVSPEHGTPVECIQIRNGYGLRLGWAFVYHRRLDEDADVRWTEIRELFCWPTFRRLGIGTALESLAVQCAAFYKSKEISLFMYQADAVVGPPRAAARLFGRDRGYQWRWRTQTGPRLAATGVKPVAA